MKTASTVKQLPIVSVAEGEEIAAVRSLLVNRKSKKIQYLDVGLNGKGIVPTVLPFEDIIGIGADYIIIKAVSNISRTSDDKSLAASLEDCLLLEGRTVLSSTGDILGTVSDYEIDETSGEIEKLLLENGEEVVGNTIVTLSAQFILADITGNTRGVPGTVEEIASQLDEGSLAYLEGKTVSSTIRSEDGTFSIEEGTVLTVELISEAERHGLLLELTMQVS